MIRFLIHRPIAVVMAFIAAMILGIVAYQVVPISLMPNISISEIVVKLDYENKEARELEQLIVKPLRSELKQVMHLNDIHSETRDGNATLRLKFNYGTQSNYAFIEVNEKIDALMSRLPRDLKRPKVIKSRAVDIPMFYLNLSLKRNPRETPSSAEHVSDEFVELSNFANEVIRRRIEQFPEVAMVDISGGVPTEIQIKPEVNALRRHGISLAEFGGLLQKNNLEIGNIVVRNFQYEYNVQFASVLKGVNEIKNISFTVGGKIVKVKDVASVHQLTSARKGSFMANGKPAITLAILKQADAKISGMQEQVTHLMTELRGDYPEVEFDVSQDQTQLLNLSISSLTQNLKYGLLFVVLIVFFFLKDIRLPFIVGASLVVSIVVSVLLFYVVDLSINIISLAGVILAVGSMIDNSIIITDNISQYREKGYSIDEACISGTTELITPLLSSNLTNVAIFTPLVFLNGIGGELIYDEAVAVTIGLGISYITGIVLIPVVYRLIYQLPIDLGTWFNGREKAPKLNRIFSTPVTIIDKLYELGFSFAFRHKIITMLFFLTLLPIGAISFRLVTKDKMPQLTQTEALVNVDWNEDIHATENRKRTVALLANMNSFCIQTDAYIGKQNFNLDNKSNLLESQTVVYVKVETEEAISSIAASCREFLSLNYPKAIMVVSPPVTIFDRIFDTSTPPLIAKVSSRNTANKQYLQRISTACKELNNSNAIVSDNQLMLQGRVVIRIDREKLLLYNVDYSALIDELKTAFGNNQITSLKSFQHYTPVVLTTQEKDVNQFIRSGVIYNKSQKPIRINALLGIYKTSDFKTIHSGREGEYTPLNFWPKNEEKEKYEARIASVVEKNHLNVSFGGALYQSEELLSEMLHILVIAVLLLYFILAAQFESLLTPLLVLIELPLSFSGVIILLHLVGYSLNLMSLIGLMVMSGIVINDSILKIDSINKLRAQGHALTDAIHQAGQKRLRAIIMTSLTSITAFIPLFFTNDLGSELQKPFAYVLITGLCLGTIISLYFVSICYYFIHRGNRQ